MSKQHKPFKQTCLVGAVLTFIGLSAAAPSAWTDELKRAQAQAAFDRNPPELIELVNDAQQWLKQHENPSYRSLGLIPDTLPGFSIFIDEPAISSDSPEGQQFLMQVEHVLDQSPEAPALFFLMIACSDRTLMIECSEIGLHTALKNQAPGNLAIWGTLAGDDQEALSGAIATADHWTQYYGQTIDAWFNAMVAVQHDRAQDWTKQSMASFATMFGSSLLHKIPLPTKLLMDVCIEEVARNSLSKLVRACDQLSVVLRNNDEFITTKISGYSLSEHLAEFQGENDRAERFATEAQAWKDWMICHINQTMFYDVRGGDEFAMRRLNMNIEFGEVGGMKRISKEMNVSCASPPSEI